ncbi:hypothetical protein K2Z84_23405 [Candidatus Binatia bacterium]|nr:hypothetical protein [Candidatus Binatia bacterium]
MRRMFLTAALAIATFGLAASSAHAQFNYPKKANKFQATMVTAYAPCTASNDTTTGALGLPACHPAVRSDTVCGFDVSNPAKPLGQGQLQATVAGAGDKLDIKLQVKLQGLDAGCIGQTLCIAPFLRASSTGCVSGDPNGCTTLEALTNPFALSGPGCGVVDSSGKLQIKTTVDTALGIDLITPGTHLTLDLARTGVRRTTGPSLPAAGALTFSAGLLAP